MTTYNINELLEKKKELEAQIVEVQSNINGDELTYHKEVQVDVSTKQTKEFEKRERVDLKKYTQKFEGLVSELNKVKTAIQKFNAENITEKLYDREKARKSYDYYTRIKNNLPKTKNAGRKTLRQDKDGNTLEYVDFEVEPMFSVEEVDKRLNEIAAQERKINTEIQKINLNAKIEL